MPVMLMMDECVGHMTEKVVIPAGRRDRDLAAAAHRKPQADFLPTRPA